MIRLDPRLTCAFNMLQGFDSVADIGSDHGKLTAALLFNGSCSRVIARDNSSIAAVCRIGLRSGWAADLPFLLPGSAQQPPSWAWAVS